MKKTSLILILFLSFFNLTHASNIASIIKLKGKATMLLPGAKEAQKISKNSKFPNGTSIVTQDKSFMILKFSDGSKITLGPKSKIVISQFKSTKKNLVGLLRGQLKAQIKKSKSSKENKFYVKTRSAAMGVRGTKFQTIYNPEGRTTSVITFEGTVDLAKSQDMSNQNLTAEKALDISLKRNSVTVNKGRYAGSTPNLKKPSTPIIISPKQFTLLKINKTFGVEKSKLTKKELEVEVTKTKKEFSKLKLTKVEKMKKVISESINSGHKPRSGGLVDLETGLYIPPTKKSQYNSKLHIYEATNDIGTISNDGSYQAPKGIKLDPIKGFVATNSAGKKVLRNLNKNIAGQIVPPKALKKNGNDLADEDYNKYFKIDD